MKKLKAFILALTMAVCTSCGSTESASDTPETTTTAATTTTAETTTTTTAETTTTAAETTTAETETTPTETEKTVESGTDSVDYASIYNIENYDTNLPPYENALYNGDLLYHVLKIPDCPMEIDCLGGNKLKINSIQMWPVQTPSGGCKILLLFDLEVTDGIDNTPNYSFYSCNIKDQNGYVVENIEFSPDIMKKGDKTRCSEYMDDFLTNIIIDEAKKIYDNNDIDKEPIFTVEIYGS